MSETLDLFSAPTEIPSGPRRWKNRAPGGVVTEGRTPAVHGPSATQSHCLTCGDERQRRDGSADSGQARYSV